MKKWIGAAAGLILLVIVGLVIQSQLPQKQTTENKAEQSTDSGEVDKSVYMDATKPVKERVAALLAQMTLEEKVAQMIQSEQMEANGGATPEQVTQFGIGSMLSGGGSAPTSGNQATDWEARINEYKTAAVNSRLGIPLIYGVDAVHGHNNVADTTIFPHNIGLGAANDPDLVKRIGAAVAEEVRATGAQWTFAPVVGIPFNERWGRFYECFGETPELVGRLGVAYIEGFQGTQGEEGYLGEKKVAATAKHFVGEGQVTDGINQGDVPLTNAEFDALLEQDKILEPYQKAVDAGVQTVMITFNSVDGVKCHESYHVITELLKDKLGFKGFVISDYNGLDQVNGATHKEKVKATVNAGMDMLMEPYDWQECMYDLIDLVNEGGVSMDRIDDAVSRILTVKFNLGLFEEKIGGDTEKQLLETVGSSEHRAIAREAVQKSQVLLKNDKVGGGIPVMEALKSYKNIVVAGSKADDLGSQCGGWTINWQGKTGNTTTGTTILKGIQDAIGSSKTVTYSEEGTITKDTEAMLVVVGEQPYAETQGDREEKALVLSNETRTILENAKKTAKEAGNEDVAMILVMVTGRPMTIADYVDEFDGIVEAWLPGTEGEGVADVLFGETDFSGTLSVTWPWYAKDIVGKLDAANQDKVLFNRETGLRKDGSSISVNGTAQIGTRP